MGGFGGPFLFILSGLMGGTSGGVAAARSPLLVEEPGATSVLLAGGNGVRAVRGCWGRGGTAPFISLSKYTYNDSALMKKIKFSRSKFSRSMHTVLLSLLKLVSC